MIFDVTFDISFLTPLTILFLLGQNCHFFAFREVQEEKHCLLSDDVCKIDIIYLQRGDTKVINFPFPRENSTPIILGEDLLSATETVNLYLDKDLHSCSPFRSCLGNHWFYCTERIPAIPRYS